MGNSTCRTLSRYTNTQRQKKKNKIVMCGHQQQELIILQKSGGYATFLNLMGRDMEEVRILAIKMIGCLLKDGSNKARGKFLHFYGYEMVDKRERDRGEEGRGKRCQYLITFLLLNSTQYVVEILKHYPFTEATYRALTEVLVGRISLEPTSVQG